jgi:hypothetical protein
MDDELGDTFYFGLGVAMNKTEAVNWFVIAAEAGDLYAQQKLGNLFAGQRNWAKASKWFQLASDQGSGSACYNLAQIYLHELNDPAKAMEMFELAMRRGSAPAMMVLGEMNKLGLHGLVINVPKAAVLFKVAIAKASGYPGSEKHRAQAEKCLKSLPKLPPPIPKTTKGNACSQLPVAKKQGGQEESELSTAQSSGNSESGTLVAGNDDCRLQTIATPEAPENDGDGCDGGGDDWVTSTNRAEQHSSRIKKPKAKAKKKKLSAAEIEEKRASFFARKTSKDALSHHPSESLSKNSSSSSAEEEDTESDSSESETEDLPLPSVPTTAVSSENNLGASGDGGGEWLVPGQKQPSLKNLSSSVSFGDTSAEGSASQSNSSTVPSSGSVDSLAMPSSPQQGSRSTSINDLVAPETAALLVGCGVDDICVAALGMAGFGSLAALSNASDEVLANCGIKKGPRLKIGKWQKGGAQNSRPPTLNLEQQQQQQQGVLSATAAVAPWSSWTAVAGDMEADDFTSSSTLTSVPAPSTSEATTAIDEDLEAQFLALLAETDLAEKKRLDEDEGAALLVESYCRGLQNSVGPESSLGAKSAAEIAGRLGAKGAPAFGGIFNPARDGDCLMRCAVEHDFGDSASATAAAAERRSESDVSRIKDSSSGVSGSSSSSSSENLEEAWPALGTDSKTGGRSGLFVASSLASGASAPTWMSEQQVAEEVSSSPLVTGGLTADELRLKVVARALEKSLSELKVKAAEVEEQLREVSSSSVSSSTAPLSEKHRSGLEEELVRLKGPAVAEVKARFETMARPGVVMGEDELQALADVRGACVQVRSLVCVKESSDWGEVLSAKTYVPRKEGAPALGIVGKETGKGGTLVLLQEARAHRMSHFQLLRLSLPSPCPPHEEPP